MRIPINWPATALRAFCFCQAGVLRGYAPKANFAAVGLGSEFLWVRSDRAAHHKRERFDHDFEEKNLARFDGIDRCRSGDEHARNRATATEA